MAVVDFEGMGLVGVGGVSVPTQPDRAPFSFHDASAEQYGVTNWVSYWAYNIKPGTSNTRANTAEPSIKFGLESHFFDGSRTWMEWNFDFQSAGGTARRFLAFGVDRDNLEDFWRFRTWRDGAERNTMRLEAGRVGIGEDVGLHGRGPWRLNVWSETADDTSHALGCFDPQDNHLFTVRGDGRAHVRSGLGVGVESGALTFPLEARQTGGGAPAVALHGTGGKTLYAGANWIGGGASIGTTDAEPVRIVANGQTRMSALPAGGVEIELPTSEPAAVTNSRAVMYQEGNNIRIKFQPAGGGYRYATITTTTT